jgi:predicted hotdog family 3-hydroxylacyl-ACP dehydratase
MIEPLPAVTDLLPLAGKAILVDKILAETSHGVVAAAHISGTHPFFSAEHSGVPSWVGVELMAQTIGLHVGLVARRENRPPRVGYLLGTRHYAPAIACFPSGAELEIRAEQLYQDTSGLGAYNCTIVCAGEVVVNATITVFQSPGEESR